MHEELLTAALEDQNLNLSEVGPLLDELANAITEVVVRGPVKQQVEEEALEKHGDKISISMKADTNGFGVKTEGVFSDEDSTKASRKLAIEGPTIHRVHFGRVGAVLENLLSH